MSETDRQFVAVALSIFVVLSVAGASATFAGSVAAASQPTAVLHSVNESTVDGGENVTVTYNASDESDVRSATVQFVSGGTVASAADVPSGNTSTVVAAPGANGTYNVQLVVTDTDNNTVVSDTAEELVVDTQGPSVGLSSPGEGAQLTSGPALGADATDNVGVESVEFRIKRNESYYNGSAFQSTETWVNATQSNGTWEFDAPGDNGTYTVSARATDVAGNTTNSTDVQPDSTQPVPGEDGKISYTVDPERPSLTNVTLTTAAGDGTVAVGDEVTIAANASDVTSSVDSVTVNASAFGESETLALSAAGGDAWERTFTVSELTVSDGPERVTVTATDAFGQATTNTSGEFTVDTAAATVGSISIDADFVGVVEDQSVRVTATNVRDANGNLVDVGTVNVSIAGQTPFAPVSVDDGDVNTTIDPTELRNETTPLGESVTVDIAGTGENSTTVTLAHEVRTYDSGWHVGGTPLPTREVFMSGNGTITTYNESAADNWTQVGTEYVAQAGAGYYLDIISDRARVGYVFEDAAESRTWTLDEGSHLVGVVSEVGEDEENTTVGTLKNYVNDQASTNLDRVEFHVRKDLFSDGVVGFTEPDSDSEVLPAYSAYYIEVTSSDVEPVTYTVGLNGYSPE